MKKHVSKYTSWWSGISPNLKWLDCRDRVGHPNALCTVWNMDVSENRGTPKWMVYNGKPYQNGWFGGTIIFRNTHIYIYICKYQGFKQYFEGFVSTRCKNHIPLQKNMVVKHGACKWRLKEIKPITRIFTNPRYTHKYRWCLTMNKMMVQKDDPLPFWAFLLVGRSNSSTSGGWKHKKTKTHLGMSNVHPVAKVMWQTLEFWSHKNTLLMRSR